MSGVQNGRLPIREFGLFAIHLRPQNRNTRLGQQMFEATLETDRFFLRLIFHSIRSRKISDKSAIISQIIHPL
jgi:hypothetical protein